MTQPHARITASFSIFVSTVIAALSILDSTSVFAQTQVAHHLILERSAFFSGRIPPPRQVNVWLTNDKLRMDDGRSAAVWRIDLGKTYTFGVRGSEYRERPLTDSNLFGADLKDSTRYEWSISPLGVDSTQKALPMRVYEFLGQTERNEIEARARVAPTLPSSLAKYCNAQLLPFWMTKDQWTLLSKTDPLLTTSVIVSVEWSTNGGEARDAFRLLRYEVVESSGEQFEPPKGAVLAPSDNKERR
jgi:hypothetical protein